MKPSQARALAHYFGGGAKLPLTTEIAALAMHPSSPNVRRIARRGWRRVLRAFARTHRSWGREIET